MIYIRKTKKRIKSLYEWMAKLLCTYMRMTKFMWVKNSLCICLFVELIYVKEDRRDQSSYDWRLVPSCLHTKRVLVGAEVQAFVYGWAGVPAYWTKWTLVTLVGEVIRKMIFALFI